MTDNVVRVADGLRTTVVRLNHCLRQPGNRRGVTPTQLTAMATLERCGPMRPGDLADQLSVTASTVSRLIEALEDGGWIAREPDQRDRRAQLLTLTAHGRETLETLRREGTHEIAEAIRALPETDQESLAAALPVLATLTDQLIASTRRPHAAADHRDQRR